LLKSLNLKKITEFKILKKSIVVMWQHHVYYVCVTFSVVRYVGHYKVHKTTLYNSSVYRVFHDFRA
jgi:hypothetical protein